ncbi:MAG: aminotransferase class I and II [Chloroflexi bacterium]|nr:aminotransferase class I and II [Chloroflexota bacterium]
MPRWIATRYATPLREGGSLPAVVATDDGDWVVKFRGAGQGPGALIAEVVAGSIGQVLGLPIPELALVEVTPDLGRAEPDPEIRELLERSPGTNAALRFLPGALPYRPGVSEPPDPARAADIVWFDALVTNIDRTPRNPNILVRGDGAWLIDHGAALYVQHTWRDPDAHARRPFTQAAEHVLLPVAGSIEDADERLAPLLDRTVLEGILARVPDDWLSVPRERFVDYLDRRLDAPRPFVADAEAARLAIARDGLRSPGRDRTAARTDA